MFAITIVALTARLVVTWFDPRVYGFIFYHHDRNLLKSWLFQIHAYMYHVYL